MALETSCDETAVAILAGTDLRTSLVSSQIALHQPYGGVVPEVASRNHLTQLQPLISEACKEAGVALGQIDAFAATSGPGLASSLLIGSSAAKGLAVALQKPYLAVNHLEGHLISPFFGGEIQPAIGLIVSGGHTILIDLDQFGEYRVLGRTRDDAAGEAFDKVGKLLGLPYPGGPEIDRLARQGDPERYQFPRGMLNSNDFQFSFSGLKTAVRYLLPKLEHANLADICASFQEAVVEVLVEKTLRAAAHAGKRLIAVSGGVSCNSRLRERFAEATRKRGLELLVAEARFCTDNAAMIAFVARESYRRGRFSSLGVDINPNLGIGA